MVCCNFMLSQSCTRTCKCFQGGGSVAVIHFAKCYKTRPPIYTRPKSARLTIGTSRPNNYTEFKHELQHHERHVIILLKQIRNDSNYFPSVWTCTSSLITLNMNATDICVTYSPHWAKLDGRKCIMLPFLICKCKTRWLIEHGCDNIPNCWINLSWVMSFVASVITTNVNIAMYVMGCLLYVVHDPIWLP